MKKIFVVGILSLLFVGGCTQKTQPNNLDNFAKCLTEKGAIMYGSVTCPHCLNQKALFGESFKYITYVECTKEFERCANLKGVPTREIGSGKYLEGEQALETLANTTNCTLP